jgi:AraC-like DNA-binding protein
LLERQLRLAVGLVLKLTEMMRTAKRIKSALSILVILTLAAGYAVVRLSHIEHALLPAQQSVYPWRVYTSTDEAQGGSSSLDLRESTYHLSFDFNLSAALQYPYVTLGLTFNDAHPEKLMNWSQYSSIWLRVKCRPGNVLSFVLQTHDEQITTPTDFNSFRPSLGFFSCSEEWQSVQVNLQRLETPEWWLRQHNLNLANRNYALDKVRGFSFVNSLQSPMSISSGVTLEEITLKGRNWYPVYVALILGLAVWGGFFYRYIPQFLSDGKDAPAIQKNSLVGQGLTPIAYQPITTNSKHERDKSAVLDYLAAKYVDSNLSVDTAVSALGINRSKINDILREETGFTFSTYLNKLRLTEAARLLSDKQMGVSEAAFAVGYSSLSYFNRVFKKEYGCTPSSYKSPTIDTPGSDGAPDNSQ